MPYAPIVGIAVNAIRRGILESVRGRGTIGDSAAIFIHHFGESAEIHILELLCGQFLYALLLIIVVAAAPSVIYILTFIVATP